MAVSVPCLKVTVDVDDCVTQTEQKEQVLLPIFCRCQSEYCNCGSSLAITQASAEKIYQHLGFPKGRNEVLEQGYRSNALHIWGTHNLSTEDVLSWLSNYSPKCIEWINDASCNVVFEDENTVLRAIADFAEPFDRRVALAAAAALASLLEKGDDDTSDMDFSRSDNLGEKSEDYKSLTVSNETLDSIEQFSQHLPPTGRWYKALSVPAQTISLFLRFPHKTDVKLPGAERRSLYYRRFGNPNYGGMTGILSRSYRRRVRLSRIKSSNDPNGDSRHIDGLSAQFAEMVANAYDDPDPLVSHIVGKSNYNIWNSVSQMPAPERPLVVYDNLYDESDQVTHSTIFPKYATNSNTRQRRNASEFPLPKPRRQPHKWPRRDRGPIPNRWQMNDEEEDEYDNIFEVPEPGTIVVLDPREPWGSALSGSAKTSIYSSSRNRIKPVSRHPRGIATVTIMPDVDVNNGTEPVEDENALRTRRLLASMSMVADIESNSGKPR
ncbi:Nuclear cap-binding protein subunit 3 [Schistosoma japonicum]|nr:Nuclear cap-binding protein subunit 3 [Schistosoma japonicum]KAH8877326.1 Nuclear cap-binding protein subunit 3 [Schistosoma japonicum]